MVRLDQLSASLLWIPGWIAQGAVIFALLVAGKGQPQEGTLGPRNPSVSGSALAICAAWAVRMVYLFVLASTGFRYLVDDDAARFLMACDWYKKPYLITWDGTWQGGTSYLHGAAMHLVSDPLAASKFVSAVFNLLGLVALFVFAEGLYRSRRAAVLAVLVVAPWWLPLAFGAAAMTEASVTLFLLAGSGLFLLSTAATGRRRLLDWWGAALCFAAATSFHMSAWILLAPILLILLIYAYVSQKHDGPFKLKTWLWFSGVSVSFCIIWLLGCWIRFGSPIEPAERSARGLVADSGVLPLSARILAYPSALVGSLWAMLPLVVFGIVWGIRHRAQQRARLRAILAAMALGLLALVATAVIANPSGPIDKPIVPLATALVPIALAPVLSLLDRCSSASQTRVSRLGIALVLLVGIFWVWDNHQRVMASLLRRGSGDAEAAVVGTWLRRESLAPHRLHLEPSGPPIRLWVDDVLNRITFLYAYGLPDKTEEWKPTNSPGAESMKEGQYLVTDRDVDDRRLILEAKLVDYNLYRLLKRGALRPNAVRPYHLEETLRFTDFGEATNLLDSASFAPESWATWSLGQDFEIKLPIADPPTRGDIVLSLHLAASLKPSHQPHLTSEISVNAVRVGRWEFNYEPGFHILERQLRIPQGVLWKSSPAVIHFHVSEPLKSPSEMGTGNDPRKLGLALMTMQLFAGK